MPTYGLLISALLCAYPFAIYPLLLRLLVGRIWPRPIRTEEPAEVPSVALVICALNERGIIEEKLQNSLALRYPSGKLHIVVVSDGSTDGTADAVRPYTSRSVELIEQPVRRGKVANLNEVLLARREDILVLSDANVLYHRDAIRRLIARFEDPSVGCVSGKVILTDSAPLLDSPTEQYYSVEWFLQEAESAVYSMPGADGAMYALRRELFVPCAGDTIIEDFVIPMAVIRQGYRAVFEPEALAWERGATGIREEFRRKVRIAAGAMQALLRGCGWPKGAPPRFWFTFVSHKLLRWMSPLSGIMALAFASISMNHTASRVVVAGFALASLMAALRLYTRLSHPILTASFYFLFGQVATACGLLKGIAGRQSVLWVKVNR
jgi:poly-beta-1,6-N-acetyl-D-glucosamine synthase